MCSLTQDNGRTKKEGMSLTDKDKTDRYTPLVSIRIFWAILTPETKKDIGHETPPNTPVFENPHSTKRSIRYGTGA
jgi:hypothetical protein